MGPSTVLLPLKERRQLSLQRNRYLYMAYSLSGSALCQLPTACSRSIAPKQKRTDHDTRDPEQVHLPKFPLPLFSSSHINPGLLCWQLSHDYEHDTFYCKLYLITALNTFHIFSLMMYIGYPSHFIF